MSFKLNVIPAALAVLLVQATAASAQGVQSWITNEAAKLQQDSAAGVLNPNQAANLQNRENQIQAQDQRYLNQNGGVLTPQEQSKIGSELRHLNQSTNRDVSRNSGMMPNGYVQPGYVPPGYVATPTGYVPANGYVPTNGYRPGYVPQGYVNTPNGMVPATAVQNPNGYHHHHHHNNNGTNGYGPNGQVWGH